MAFSQVSYTGNGVQTTFSIPFPYLNKTDVNVSVGGVSASFSWATDSTITISPAPALGSLIFISRITNVSSAEVTFADGSTIQASDLNTQTSQDLYVAQEARDLASNSIAQDPVSGQLNAGFKRIINVADPQQAQDAVNLEYITPFLVNASGYATSAQGSSAAAAASATAAATSATNSANSAAAAAASADAANSVVASGLPTPTTTSIGGVKAIVPVTHEFLTGLDNTGALSLAQPTFADIAGTAAVTQVPVMVGDTGSGGQAGLVPAPPAGAGAAGKFLAADGTWGELGAAVSGRNKLLNGALAVNQSLLGDQALGISATQGGGIVADRWQLQTTQIDKISVQRAVISGNPDGHGQGLLCKTVTSSPYTPASADQFWLYQSIEAVNLAGTQQGTGSAISVTLSFWAQASVAGAYSAAMWSYNTNRAYVFNYTISVANTWQKFTVTIPGDTGGSGNWNWSHPTDGYAVVGFNLGAGSLGTVGSGNAWAAATTGPLQSVTGSIQLTEQAVNSTLTLTGLQLEINTVATSFEFKSVAAYLSDCLPYFEASAAPLVGTVNSTTSSTKRYVQQSFQMTKRATPSMSFFATATPVSGSPYTPNPSAVTVTVNGFLATYTLTSATDTLVLTQWDANAEI